MPFVKGKQKTGGRKQGVGNKTTSLKRLLQEVLDDNQDKVRAMLNDMCNTRRDLKWLLQLKASLEPKDQNVSFPDGLNLIIKVE